MDGIATALSYVFEEDYSCQSSNSEDGGYGQYPVAQHQEYPSHCEVVNVLLHREESNMSNEPADLYNNSSPDQYYSMESGNGVEVSSSSGHEMGWYPEYTTHSYHTSDPIMLDEDTEPKHKILLQRTHTKRSKGGHSRSGATKFEDETKKAEYKKAACERERARMKDCNKIFAQLRAGLPNTRASGKRLSKIETLRMAIRYIKHLKMVLSYPPGAPLPQHLLTFDPHH